MSAVTIVAVSRRAAAPMVPIGSSSAASGSHCTSSGRSVPSGCSTATTIAMASSGTRPGMNGHVITRPVSAARWIALDRTATYSSWSLSRRGAMSPEVITGRRVGSRGTPSARRRRVVLKAVENKTDSMSSYSGLQHTHAVRTDVGADPYVRRRGRTARSSRQYPGRTHSRDLRATARWSGFRCEAASTRHANAPRMPSRRQSRVGSIDVRRARRCGHRFAGGHTLRTTLDLQTLPLRVRRGHHRDRIGGRPHLPSAARDGSVAIDR